MDARLLAGLRGAVEHIAGRHGIGAEARLDFAAEVGQACRAARGKSDSPCIVTIDDFEDHVEIRVVALGNLSPAAALHSSSGKFATAPRACNAEMAKGAGRVSTTLVKYFHTNPAQS